MQTLHTVVQPKQTFVKKAGEFASGVFFLHSATGEATDGLIILTADE